MSASAQSSPPVDTAELRVERLTVSAGGNRIMHGLNLRLLGGELCGLIGPSGAGKSTLIKSLLDLRTPDSGRIHLNGAPISAAGPVGYVPQDDALHKTLSVGQTLAFAARLRTPDLSSHETEARISELARTLELDERLDTRVKNLSGGQRKRLSVALELLSQPRLLILDEPTSGLDPGMEARMMELFAKIAGGGRIVMVATHAMQSLKRCHALAVLVAGHLCYFGTPDNALTFFEVQRFAGIFSRLPEKPVSEWKREYSGNAAARKFSARTGPAADVPAAIESAGDERKAPSPSPPPTAETPEAALAAFLAAQKTEGSS